MRIKIIILIILILAFIGGFISFEKKKGKYGEELREIRSEFDRIISKQTRIEDLKKKRADYFRKVFVINRPGNENRSLTGLLNVLTMMDNREVRFSGIEVTSRAGTIEFELSGFSRKPGQFIDFTDKLESSAGVFIISKTVDAKNPNQFILRGEVSAE